MKTLDIKYCRMNDDLEVDFGPNGLWPMGLTCT